MGQMTQATNVRSEAVKLDSRRDADDGVHDVGGASGGSSPARTRATTCSSRSCAGEKDVQGAASAPLGHARSVPEIGRARFAPARARRLEGAGYRPPPVTSPVVSGNLSPASCSVATVVVEQSAEARPASDHAERPVVVARRRPRPDDLAADRLVMALGEVVLPELLEQVAQVPFAEDDESSSGGESPPAALIEPDVRLSPHPAPTLQPPARRRVATGQRASCPAARCDPASASTRAPDTETACTSVAPMLRGPC